jgi:hypothetical protein
MMNPDIVNDWINRYNEGILQGKELNQFLAILRNDPGVKAETMLGHELTEFLGDRDLLEFRKFLDQTGKIKKNQPGIRFLLIAASMICLLALAANWIRMLPKGMVRFCHVASESISRGRSAPGAVSLQQIPGRAVPSFPGIQRYVPPGNPASCYTPLPTLEELVGIVTRAERFTLLAPGTVSKIHTGNPIRFHWEKDPRQSLAIELVNNKGKLVACIQGLTGDSITIETKEFPMGLYYFRFLREGDLVYVGKVLMMN